jgi:hypothetical protein
VSPLGQVPLCEKCGKDLSENRHAQDSGLDGKNASLRRRHNIANVSEPKYKRAHEREGNDEPKSTTAAEATVGQALFGPINPVATGK